jgi:error-prone DNA polymerase
VPLFQEQAMQIAIVGAGFTPGEADKLRRAMATFKRVGTIGTFRDKMIEGMVARGYEREFAERCFHQIEGFGEYGFPKATPRASRSWSMPRPGSSATTRTSSARRC